MGLQEKLPEDSAGSSRAGAAPGEAEGPLQPMEVLGGAGAVEDGDA